jgi:hypothetical protein
MPQRWLPLIALVLSGPFAVAACGDEPLSTPFAPVPAKVDSAVPASGTEIDAGTLGAPKPACDLAAPFGTPVAVGGVNTPGTDWCPRLSNDQLELYLTRQTPDAGFELLAFSRPSVETIFSGERLLTTLNSPQVDECAFQSADGLTLYFDSRRTGNYDLYIATRSALDEDFGQVRPLGSVNTPDDEWWQWPVGDELFYTARRGEGRFIFRTTRASDGTYGAGAVVPELDLPGTEESGASLTADGLRVYFGRYGTTAPDRGIDTASRSSVGAPFGSAMRVAELDSPGHDDVGWISPDGCSMYFASDRNGDGGASTDIFRATKPPLGPAR